jgi:hypothetical protein
MGVVKMKNILISIDAEHHHRDFVSMIDYAVSTDHPIITDNKRVVCVTVDSPELFWKHSSGVRIKNEEMKKYRYQLKKVTQFWAWETVGWFVKRSYKVVKKIKREFVWSKLEIIPEVENIML